MKKILLLSVALLGLICPKASAVEPADCFDWYYGSYPGTKVGPNNTMPSFGTVIGYAKDGVKLEIPGTYEMSTIERYNEKGDIVEQEIPLLDLSSKKVRIQGPTEAGVPASSKVDVNKAIFACYSTSEWPTPFANGKQECKAMRFGLMSYEVSKYPGTYDVTFPAGSIYINDVPCEEFCVTFNIEDNTVYTPTELSFKTSPMDDYPLEKLIYPQISINNWDEDKNKNLYETKGVNPVIDVTLTTKETNEVRICPFMGVGGTVTRLTWEADLQKIITTPGTYILKVPEGKIRLLDLSTGRNVTNETVEFTFIVQNDNDPVKKYYEGAPNITPGTGNVTAIQCLEINQPNGYAVALPSKVVPFTFTLPDGTKKNVTPRDGWRGHTVYIDLDAPFTAKGEYTLSIPEDGLVYYKATSDGDIADENSPLYTRAQTIKYNLTWGEETELAYTSDPANNSSVFKSLENIFITFDEPVTPTYGLLATLKWPDGSTVHYPLDASGNEDKTALPYQYKVTYSDQKSRFMVGLHYPSQYGTYELIIPAGIAKTASGKINKEFTIKVNWLEREVADIDIKSDPENGIALSTIPQEIYLTIPDNVETTRLGDGGITTVWFYTPGSDTGVKRYIKESGSKYYVDLRESFDYSEETKGLYTIQIPEGSFICTMNDGREVLNAAKTFSWRLTATGVYEVSLNDGRVTVYDINGKLLMRDVEKDQLNSLKGVYIVNGIKTVLR